MQSSEIKRDAINSNQQNKKIDLILKQH